MTRRECDFEKDDLKAPKEGKIGVGVDLKKINSSRGDSSIRFLIKRKNQETRRVKSQTQCYVTPLHLALTAIFLTFKILIALFTKLFLAKVIVP